jgi:ATP-dependent DNA helicase RecG
MLPAHSSSCWALRWTSTSPLPTRALVPISPQVMPLLQGAWQVVCPQQNRWRDKESGAQVRHPLDPSSHQTGRLPHLPPYIRNPSTGARARNPSHSGTDRPLGSKIQALKFQGLVESYESRPSSLTLADLDRELLARARQGAGLEGLSDEEYLLKRKLADRRGSRLALRQAAELLFAQQGPEHPNTGVRVFRVVGTERRLGAEHNVEERPRIEGNLPAVWQEALSVVGGLMRQPSRLVGNRFRPVSEYPRFSWQEALLNAIAHCDYSVQGAGIEVWLFDDRMEVTSPGGLLPELSLDELLSLRRVHCSRNPRLMRTLVDLGLTRDQGEGIPRMFAEMAAAFLPTPRIDPTPRRVSVVLRNTTTLGEGDRSFISRIGGEELSDEEFRALLQAHRNTQVDNASLRSLMGIDTLGASQILRRLRDRGLLELHPAGSQSFYTLAPRLRSADGADRVKQAVDRGEQLDSQLLQAIQSLGVKRHPLLVLWRHENWST